MSERLHLIRIAVAQRCRYENDWDLSWWNVPFTGWTFSVPGKAPLCRLGYALKTALCIAFGLRRDLYASIDPPTVTVAEWDWESWSTPDFMGPCWDFSALVVAHGWRQWAFDTYRDGTA